MCCPAAPMPPPAPSCSYILKRGGQETYGQRLISLNIKTKKKMKHKEQKLERKKLDKK